MLLVSDYKNSTLLIQFIRFIYVYIYITANITIVPLSAKAQLFTLVNFTCDGTGNAYVLEWTIQGHSLTDLTNQDREISVTTDNISVGVLSSVLTIKALPINNGIIIACIVVDKNLDVDSKGATLEVNG